MSKFVTLHGFGSSGIGTSEGVELNFEVVGGTTEPANLKENTIWINTEVPISGYTFSSDTIDGNVPDGFVVIKFDPYYQNGNGGFNVIIDDNEIFIKPVSATQYIGKTNTWEQKTIKVYQNEWVEVTSVPEFEYNGAYELVTDGDNWEIKFLTSGTLAFKALNNAKKGIEAFLVGGGGAGATGDLNGAGGGGGGYTTTLALIPDTSISYSISIGGSGGVTSAFGATAINGSPGSNTSGGAGTGNGGNGGGAATVDYGAGSNGSSGGAGVYAFGDSTVNYKYGAGGGGGGGYPLGNGASGGASGGGKGGSNTGHGGATGGTNGIANSGGGGGGGGGWFASGGAGGSGIVIIRNKRG